MFVHKGNLRAVDWDEISCLNKQKLSSPERECSYGKIFQLDFSYEHIEISSKERVVI